MTIQATVYTATQCRHSAKVLALLENNGVSVTKITVTGSSRNRLQFEAAVPGAKTLPQVVIDGTVVGGWMQIKNHPGIDVNARKPAKEPRVAKLSSKRVVNNP